ncbi:MAG: hypothetical protein QNL62_26010 [Gammaproteobacteria bacterium]|nr:hypothetical protein [Gammaproteobacteria bacterium]
MNLEDMTTILSVIIVMSMASERLVDIVKGFIPAINRAVEDDPQREIRRKAYIQILAVLSGIVTALIGSEVLGATVPAS